MKYRIIYAPRSRRDLDGIHTYIAAESGSPAVADRFLDKLFAACDGLGVFPARFAPYPHVRSWRMMPFESYLVFFEIREGVVRVGHIRHAARRPFGG